MRLLGLSLAVLLAAFAVTACNSKSSSSTSSSDQSSATATAAATDNGGGTTSNEAGGSQVPSYPGATTQASGSSSNAMNGGSAAGTVMSTADSFDKVYAWYQQHMPAGSEKSHTTAPVESAVFTIGEAGSDQTSLTLTTSQDKTMITIAHVKM
jgi:hypothetical protein